MKAAITTRIGPPDVIQVKEVSTPQPKMGEVLISVMAAGLNRSEMYTRQGHSPGVSFPRIQGIECVGLVASCPSRTLEEGTQVAAIMGEMGRAFDGGYAEYTVVPEAICFPFESTLPWATLGAIPEMFQTVNGSLTLGLELKEGETLLIRGGTSSIGLTTAQLAKSMGAHVIATTRNDAKRELLLENGADEIIIDEGEVASKLRKNWPQGVHKVLELVGTTTLIDSMKCARPYGIVCMTGILGNAWTLKEFSPFSDIPPGVRLTSYGGDAENLDTTLLQSFIDRVARGDIRITIDRTLRLEDIADAHVHMEEGKGRGKLVLVNDHLHV